MNLVMDQAIAVGYSNNSQRARVMTEGWVARELYCPRCGEPRINHLTNNRPVADFACPICASQYELKSKSGLWSDRVNDGAYNTLIERITSNTNPDWLFLVYENKGYSVTQLVLIPRHFFTPRIVEKRPPLPPTARRAGWVGCTITLGGIPKQGRIPIVKDGNPVAENEVHSALRVADSLAIGSLEARGWLMDVLTCVNALPGEEFSLADVYQSESHLQVMHPDNRHVKAKIRQQLQVLRDRGIIEFLGRGKYRKVDADE